jgi:glutathione S-transferase
MSDTNLPILFIIPGACSLGSMITLELLGLQYQICITDEQIRSSLEFKKINPTGKVAALNDQGICVGENIAIIQYLLDAYMNSEIENHFAPSRNDLKNRAKMYQWLSYCSSTLHPAFSQVNYAHKYAPEHTEDFKKNAYQRLLVVLDYIDRSLQSGYLLFEDRMSVVDAQAYGLLRWLSYTPNGEQIVSERINIKRFLQNMENIQQVNNALSVEQQRVSSLIDSKFAGYFTINI